MLTVIAVIGFVTQGAEADPLPLIALLAGLVVIFFVVNPVLRRLLERFLR